MSRFPSPAARRGFSLIEVLISTSVLMVIVVLVSIVFQQSNGAFREGRNKVQGLTALRSVFGVISRDLAMAVVDDGNRWAPYKIKFCVPTSESVETITYEIIGEGTLKRTVDREGGNTTSSVVADSLKTISFSFDPKRGSDSDGSLPNRIDIVASIEEDGASSSYVGGHSYGPDGQSGTDDDIWVGKKN